MKWKHLLRLHGTKIKITKYKVEREQNKKKIVVKVGRQTFLFLLEVHRIIKYYARPIERQLSPWQYYCIVCNSFCFALNIIIYYTVNMLFQLWRWETDEEKEKKRKRINNSKKEKIQRNFQKAKKRGEILWGRRLLVNNWRSEENEYDLNNAPHIFFSFFF